MRDCDELDLDWCTSVLTLDIVFRRLSPSVIMSQIKDIAKLQNASWCSKQNTFYCYTPVLIISNGLRGIKVWQKIPHSLNIHMQLFRFSKLMFLWINEVFEKRNVWGIWAHKSELRTWLHKEPLNSCMYAKYYDRIPLICGL